MCSFSAEPEMHINEICNERVSFDDHKNFLRRFPEHSKAIKDLNEKIDKFFNSFMVSDELRSGQKEAYMP